MKKHEDTIRLILRSWLKLMCGILEIEVCSSVYENILRGTIWTDFTWSFRLVGSGFAGVKTSNVTFLYVVGSSILVASLILVIAVLVLGMARLILLGISCIFKLTGYEQKTDMPLTEVDIEHVQDAFLQAFIQNMNTESKEKCENAVFIGFPLESSGRIRKMGYHPCMLGDSRVKTCYTVYQDDGIYLYNYRKKSRYITYQELAALKKKNRIKKLEQNAYLFGQMGAEDCTRVELRFEDGTRYKMYLGDLSKDYQDYVHKVDEFLKIKMG